MKQLIYFTLAHKFENLNPFRIWEFPTKVDNHWRKILEYN